MSFEILEAKKKFQKKFFHKILTILNGESSAIVKKISSVFLVVRTRVRFFLLTNITKSVIF